MANPIQEYQTARRMPIPALVAVLNGQSDMVSLGVAHAALKEKMEAEIAKKGAGAMQMAQAPKVVQKDMQMAQGLASTPADVNVPMGGIVGNEGQMTQSAAGGGSVVAFQAGGSPPTTFGGMMQQRAASAPGFMGRVRQGLGALDRFATGRGGLLGPQLALTPTATNVGEQEYLDLIKKLQSLGFSAEMIEAMTPEQRVAAAQRGPLQAGPTDTGGVPTQSLADLEAAQAKPEGAPPAGGGVADIAASQAQAKKPMSLQDMINESNTLAAQFASDAEPTKTNTEFANEMMDALKAQGYDFNLISDQIGKLAAEKEELKKDRKEAGDLRLIEAGLGILGGESPHAFVNIGKGATPALQGFAKDIKELKKESRALERETMKLQQMNNEMKRGVAVYGLEAQDKQRERIAKHKQKENEIRASMFTNFLNRETQKEIAQLGAATQIAVSRKPSAQVDLINQFPGKTFEEKYANMVKSTQGQTILKEMATEYMAMSATQKEMFDKQNPELAAQLKQAISGALPGLGMLTAPPSGASVLP